MATAPPTEAVAVAAASRWVDQAAAARARTTGQTVAQVVGSWAAFRAWYESQAVAAQASGAAAASTQGQQLIGNAMAEYIAQLVALLTGASTINVPNLGDLIIRGGVDLTRVHSRPAETYRWNYALTLDEELAQQRALERAQRLIEDDAMLAARQGANTAMEKLGVTRYRRILRPELSESGPCGLCVVASGRVYRTKDLMPLHARCKCDPMPVLGDLDVGAPINQADLERIYEAAGNSTLGEDLKRVRVQVNEHGELGPVLTVRGQRFLTAAERAAAVTPEQSQKNLDLLLGNLDTLYSRLSAGEALDGPVAYQEAQVARLAQLVA